MGVRRDGAHIYIRRNGRFGSSCDGSKDTGHYITEDSGRFSVWDYDGEHTLCRNVTREEAEACITQDWRHP